MTVMQDTPSVRPTILVAEDDRDVREVIEFMLKCQGFKVQTACDGEELLEHFRASDPSAIVLDIMMPNLDGFDTLKEIRAMNATVPVVMLSGLSTPLNIVNAMRCGATDFLAKPVTHEDLRRVLGHVLAMPGSPESLSLNAESPEEMFVGQSAAMLALKASLRTIAASDVPILIEGETGTGKEMLARQIHQYSGRAAQPFIKLNCAAVPSELLESELFGYERGAFTGAMQRKPGVFELADGGTLLLDEIGDMDIRLQAKLLQVVQDQEFRRLGGRETVRVDVRMLAATHRNLLNAVAAETFREDLYYRLNVFTLTVPALRERREDIPDIAEFLMRKHSKGEAPPVALTERLRKAMMSFSWPGNIRQLENIVRKLSVLRNPNVIAAELENLAGATAATETAPVEAVARTSVQTESTSPSALEQVAKTKADEEARVILEALHATRWNRKQAAARLKIDYKAFLYKMKKLAIEDETSADPSTVQPAGKTE
ncbi:MAG: sigma-54 dependent transcriptional regulator [Acidobacteriota bacterium]